MGIIFFLLFITAIIYFPYKKFAHWINSFANGKYLSYGFICISVRFLYNLLIYPTDISDVSSTTKTDLLNSPQAYVNNIAQAGGWLLFIAGIIIIIWAFIEPRIKYK